MVFNFNDEKIAYHMEQYKLALAEYRKDWAEFYAKVEELLGGEIPEFISIDYMDQMLYEQTPEQFVNEIKGFFLNETRDSNANS